MFRFFLIFFLGTTSWTLRAQVLVDDFESGSLINWNVLQGSGEVVNAPAFNGTSSARLFKPDLGGDAQSLALHNTFRDNWGIYEMHCFANGPISDVQFLFQYLDGANYYAVSCNPAGTDNPEIHLYKVVGGSLQTLARIPPTFGLNTWFKLTLEHYCEGTLRVSIDDQLLIEINDRDITAPGTIAMGAWGESSFFDDITFTSVLDTSITQIVADICSGTFYDFGANRLNRSGTYFDTLTSANGCDSIVQLELTVRPHFLVSVSDTICGGDFYLFGADSLRETGRFSTSLMSIYGCDSLVELDLQVLGGDTMTQQLNLCDGDFTLFNNDTIRAAGSYFDVITLDAGCSTVFRLDVSLDDPILDLGPDLTVCFDEIGDLSLVANNFDSAIWSDGSQDLQLLVTQPGTYHADAFVGSCMASDTVVVTEECIVEAQYFVPNAFSPNGDGHNETFQLESAVSVTYRMEIYNRWGNQIFKTENGTPWDGTMGGEPLPSGVYLYVIEVENRRLAGDVMLLP